jgi:hypothetical protein
MFLIECVYLIPLLVVLAMAIGVLGAVAWRLLRPGELPDDPHRLASRPRLTTRS